MSSIKRSLKVISTSDFGIVTKDDQGHYQGVTACRRLALRNILRNILRDYLWRGIKCAALVCNTRLQNIPQCSNIVTGSWF
jgi:hypothetical protein